MRNIWVLALCFFSLSQHIISQAPPKKSSSAVYHSLQKLNFLGSALYVAAHPDDENTKLISYLSNKVMARTAYLSLTRGDGGQNLIGPELQDLLGVLRTQELLAARQVDGGEQLFSRAVDFGYSKHPDETLDFWNKDAVLSDVVWAIRNFRPDVIINRFDHRSPGTTHGHHTASAMLSYEAFDLTNDPGQFPEQLSHTQVWQPRRLYFNTSWWFYGSEEKFLEADKSALQSVDTGVYYPLLGISNNEIASWASSQHLCQGFGRLTARGSEKEYVELLKGDMPKDPSDLFEGINTTWSRIQGGEAVGKILYAVERDFDFSDPAKHLPQLLEAYKMLQKVPDAHWRALKSEELKTLILDVSGLFLEASATQGYASPGERIKANIEALNRSAADIVLKRVDIVPTNTTTDTPIPLKNNERQLLEISFEIPLTTPYTSPYWLNEKGTLGMYRVPDQGLIGRPETPRAFHARFVLDFKGFEIGFDKPIVHKYAKPEKGEIYAPFEILPEATAGFKDKVMIFPDSDPKEVEVIVKAQKDNIKGEISLRLSEGWKTDTEERSFEIDKKGDQKTVVFKLWPPAGENEGSIVPVLRVNGKEIVRELTTIAYDHVPAQSVLRPSEAKVVRLDIKRAGENIGYIAGAGDEIPQSLEQIGYKVHRIDPISIGANTLQQYDAIVMGIRAYNVVEELKYKQPFLLDYVKNGGNLIVQYNTASRWAAQFDSIAPYPLKISQDRVTDENAPVTILAKDHPIINFPNTISGTDFVGWIQERGLYFPSEWDPKFTPILAMNDPNETEKKGSLLVAPYGKGNYIYTGLSFFREMPAGVPGAFKLFANILSVGKEKVETKNKAKR